jgi:CheY-like chemotaxis protein
LPYRRRPIWTTIGRYLLPFVSVALITVLARSEDRTRALLSGCQVHVAKPVEPAERIATVAGLAGRAPAPGRRGAEDR